MKTIDKQLSEQDQRDWELYIDKIFKSSSNEIAIPVYKEDYTPRRRIDLHGMTVQQSYHALRQFIAEHSEAGSSDIVVITGKSGQIFQEFQEWCKGIKELRKWEPIIDSKGGIGSFRLWLKKK